MIFADGPTKLLTSSLWTQAAQRIMSRDEDDTAADDDQDDDEEDDKHDKR